MFHSVKNMGNYIAKQYNKMMYRDPTINSMYYDTAIRQYKNGGKYYCLKIDRILDAENQIYIGVAGRNNSDDKQVSLQAIRIGDYTNKYYRLLQFTEEENKLKYNFEDDVTLTLIKEQNDILLRFSHVKDDKFISKKIDPIIVKWFKPISMASKEFDKIYDLFEEGRTD